VPVPARDTRPDIGRNANNTGGKTNERASDAAAANSTHRPIGGNRMKLRCIGELPADFIGQIIMTVCLAGWYFADGSIEVSDRGGTIIWYDASAPGRFWLNYDQRRKTNNVLVTSGLKIGNFMRIKMMVEPTDRPQTWRALCAPKIEQADEKAYGQFDDFMPIPLNFGTLLPKHARFSSVGHFSLLKKPRAPNERLLYRFTELMHFNYLLTMPTGAREDVLQIINDAEDEATLINCFIVANKKEGDFGVPFTALGDGPSITLAAFLPASPRPVSTDPETRLIPVEEAAKLAAFWEGTMDSEIYSNRFAHLRAAGIAANEARRADELAVGFRSPNDIARATAAAAGNASVAGAEAGGGLCAGRAAGSSSVAGGAARGLPTTGRVASGSSVEGEAPGGSPATRAADGYATA